MIDHVCPAPCRDFAKLRLQSCMPNPLHVAGEVEDQMSYASEITGCRQTKRQMFVGQEAVRPGLKCSQQAGVAGRFVEPVCGMR